MLNSKSFLALDCGASNLKLAEFQLNDAGGLSLRQYGFKPLGQEGTQENTREQAMLQALQEILSEKSPGGRNVNICAPGFHTFSKFVKLPPVDTSKVTQIIQYEAQQNVPFPLEEVVWDYQILGATPTGELEVLLVAIKSDIVEGLFRVAETAGLRLQLVDVSPAALCNAFRYNYPDLEGCTMLLDIGAKTSNLLFFEKSSVYSRGINIGANSITQDFMREARLTYNEAERIKIAEGFVSLGGAYEEPENPHQAAISKIARQVMTRLHIQVNQTVQFYRGQQGGAAPERVFLSGGAAVMPYTAQFFSEKLNLPVDYFNPFRNVQIDPSLDLDDLAKVAHAMGEVVGLGLRNLAHCPVELNLMPKSSLKRQEFNQKKPYLIASLFCLILVVFAFGWFYDKLAGAKAKALDDLSQQVGPLEQQEVALNDAMRELDVAEAELERYTAWMEDRFYWAQILTQFRDGLLAVEKQKEDDYKAKTGVWIEKLVPMLPAEIQMVGGPRTGPDGSLVVREPENQISPDVEEKYGTTRQPSPGRTRPGTGAAARQRTGPEMSTIILYCRAVSLNAVAPDANTKIAYAVASEFQSRTNYFDPAGTVLSGTLGQEGVTFTFEVTVKLKRPMEL